MGKKNKESKEGDGSINRGNKKLTQGQLATANAMAGALAGCIARFVVGPLDVLKIRFQVQLEPIAASGVKSKYTSLHQALVTIVKEEGIRALWRGTVPGQLLTIPYTAVQFVTLQQCKTLSKSLFPNSDHPLHPSLPFISGAAAGAAGTIASYPFDLLRTTLAAQGEPKVYTGMMEAAKGITSTTGVAGLYRGLGVTLLEIIPYAALQFGLYDAFMEAANKARIRRNNNNSNNNNGGGSRNKNTDNNKNKIGHSSIQTFLCGLAAGTIAKLGTHPLDVAKKRFQVAGLARNVAYGQRIAPESVTSLSLCCREMLQKEGIAGFYKGALPSVMKAAPAAAVTFAAYEAILRAIVAAKTKDINMNGGDGDLVEKRVLD